MARLNFHTDSQQFAASQHSRAGSTDVGLGFLPVDCAQLAKLAESRIQGNRSEIYPIFRVSGRERGDAGLRERGPVHQ